MAYRLLSTVKKLENNLLFGTKQCLILRNKSVSKQRHLKQTPDLIPSTYLFLVFNNKLNCENLTKYLYQNQCTQTTFHFSYICFVFVLALQICNWSTN